jgi:CRISPR-associated endoribonuclease Cas6
MNFATPFVFSRKNSKPHLALPLPEIVFGGLSKTWNFMVAREVFPYDEVYNLAYTSLAISEFDLKSTLTHKKGGKLIGATGHVTYELLSKDPVAMHIFSTLAQYAFYAGVGKETSKGMGQVRLP